MRPRLDLEAVLVGAALAGGKSLELVPEELLTPEVTAALRALRAGDTAPVRKLLGVAVQQGILSAVAADVRKQVATRRLGRLMLELRMLSVAPNDEYKKTRLEKCQAEIAKWSEVMGEK